MKIIISLLPVIAFLIFLIFIDSFKLVKIHITIICILWGCISAMIAYFANTKLFLILNENLPTYSKYIAPYLEESLKMILLIFLIKYGKIGFLTDGIIYGFAIGSGFSIVENIFYMYHILDPNPLIWIVRGFGTGIMHGGTTAILMMLVMSNTQRNANIYQGYLSGLFLAILIHAFYNQFIISPLVSTVIIIIILPVIFSMIFQKNESEIKSWLFDEFDSEVQRLMMIRKGQFTKTKAGSFFLNITNQISRLVVVDIYNYIHLYAEISLLAKRNMLLKEQGIQPPVISGIEEKINELKKLEKIIGKTALITIAPVLNMSKKDLWKLTILK